jgi:di/tricarboxylate transporter
MVTPGSRFIDLPISQIDMMRQYGVSIIGLKRRDRMMRQRLGDIRLQSGDVLLVIGPSQTIENLSGGKDFFPVAGSKRILPAREKAPLAATIFFLTIGAAVTGMVKIPVAATIGAIVMIITGCLNLRQAARAFDRQVFLLVGCVLALGHVLQVTEGATAIANALLSLPIADIPLVTASMLFLLIAIATNILSNNACAVLFTPIAISVAGQLGVDPYIFAYLVIFAANCCFASPIGYQTNLMVMGPGQYKFSDFIRAGIPLILILWVVFIGIAKFYYGL